MKYFSMFSGIGGFEYGIRQSEIKSEDSADNQSGTSQLSRRAFCVGFSEIDKYAKQIYQSHYKGHKNYGDATKIDTRDLPDFDCLVGGFPCQAFSIAGKRRGFDEARGTLFFEIARILRDKRPRCVVLENVKGLLSHDGGKTFQTILKVLSDIGYGVEWQVLNSKNFGVPQNRERVFIIGHLRGAGGRKVFPITKSCRQTLKRIQGDVSGKGYKSQQDRTYFKDGIMGCLPSCRTENKVNVLIDDYKIRRLTPTECERLQGFDNIEKTVILKVCLDHQKKNVNAETQNPKLQKLVENVERINIKEIVLSVENNLDLKHPLINKLVQQNVLINLGESKVELLNQEKLLLSANNVVKKNQFHQHINPEDFALLNVGLYSILEKIIHNGEVESHQKENPLILKENGKKLVKLSGKEIMLPAEYVKNDLIILKKLLKSIMSDLSNTKNCEQRLTILSSYVINAIIGFIPREILNQDTFTIILNSKLGWTFGVSDTSRYKCLGNAVTTNVITDIFNEMYRRNRLTN